MSLCGSLLLGAASGSIAAEIDGTPATQSSVGPAVRELSLIPPADPGSAPTALEPAREIREAPTLPRSIDLVSEPRDIWERIRNGFAMPDLDHPLVVDRQAYYLNRPEYLKRMIERSRPYLYHIVVEIEKRGLPTELALLPIVESAYNPMAYSRSHASGMWQFIPSTGKRYDLKQTWWFDDRRDIVASTTAALDYLQSIYEMNGDWQLALASYNWGENAVARAIAKNQARGLPADFSHLTMPAETRYYVPKLQAIKNIVANPGLFGLELPYVPNRAYFTTIETNRDIDVRLAAKFAEMPLEDFLALNPANNRPVISTQAKTSIVLPMEKVDVFNANLEANERPLSSWKTYALKSGDRIEKVAAAYGVSVSKLKAINGIKPKGRFATGQTLLLPVPGTAAAHEPLPMVIPAVASAPAPRAPYVVKKGDTLATIAGRFGVSIDDLRRWNKVAQGRLAAGQQLTVSAPRATVKKSAHGKTVKKAPQTPKKTAKPVRKAKAPAKKS